MDAAECLERVIDVRQIAPRSRHPILLKLFDHLEPEQSLQLVTDHDPRPLHYQLESKYGACCNWSYLERGPDLWRVRLRHMRGQNAGTDRCPTPQ